MGVVVLDKENLPVKFFSTIKVFVCRLYPSPSRANEKPFLVANWDTVDQSDVDISSVSGWYLAAKIKWRFRSVSNMCCDELGNRIFNHTQKTNAEN